MQNDVSDDANTALHAGMALQHYSTILVHLLDACNCVAIQRVVTGGAQRMVLSMCMCMVLSSNAQFCRHHVERGKLLLLYCTSEDNVSSGL